MGWMMSKKYDYSPSSRSSYAIDSLKFTYKTNTGGEDNVKIDISYLNRTHVLPPHFMELNVFDYVCPVKINVCDMYDIYGAKMAALMNRIKPRDVFDIYTFIENNANNVDFTLLRRSYVFYNCVGSKPKFLNFENLDKIAKKEFDKDLVPFLHKAPHFDCENAYEKISTFFNDHMQFSDNERRFVTEFKDGHYDPRILFGYNDISVRLGWHPAAFRVCRISDPSQQKKAMATFTRMQGRGEDSLKGLLCLDLLEKVKKQYGEDDTFKDLYYGEDVFPAERDNERGLMYRISICSDNDNATLSFFKSSGRYDAKKPDEYYVGILNDCKSIRSSGKPLPQTDNNSNNPYKGGPT